jgi:broad specificity phosphatase PhoE
MTRVYLIRHADVENPGRVLYGHLSGFPLSKLGRAQAVALGEQLRESGLNRIVHSPLSRADETARAIAAGVGPHVVLESDPELREAEFSRYLQGIPYWQIPLRRPLWFVHKARRGLLPGDESIAEMGGRILDVARRLDREHPGETAAIVSHADPLQAAWVLIDGRPQTERELYRKQVQRAGVLELDLEDGKVIGYSYRPAPVLGNSEPVVPAQEKSA